MDGVSKMDVFTKTEIIMMIMVVSLIIIGFIVSTIFDVINYQEKAEKKKKKTLVNEDLDYLKDDVNEILLEEEEEVYKQDDVLLEEEEENHSLVMESSEPKEDIGKGIKIETNRNICVVYHDYIVNKKYKHFCNNCYFIRFRLFQAVFFTIRFFNDGYSVV